MPPHDRLCPPSYYVSKSGRQFVEITHLYLLGPELTQAANYIARAGKKTADPSEDVRKAAHYLRIAAEHNEHLVFGLPDRLRPSFEEVVADFEINPWFAPALRLILMPLPVAVDCLEAASVLDLALEAHMRARLPAANSGNAA